MLIRRTLPHRCYRYGMTGVWAVAPVTQPAGVDGKLVSFGRAPGEAVGGIYRAFELVRATEVERELAFGVDI